MLFRLGAAVVAAVFATGCMVDLPEHAPPAPSVPSVGAPTTTMMGDGGAGDDQAGGALLASPNDIVGNYDTNWGPLQIAVDPNAPPDTAIIGVGLFGRQLAGKIANGRYTYAWTGISGPGRGYFERLAGGTISGRWGYGSDDTNGGAWTGAVVK